MGIKNALRALGRPLSNTRLGKAASPLGNIPKKVGHRYKSSGYNQRRRNESAMLLSRSTPASETLSGVGNTKGSSSRRWGELSGASSRARVTDESHMAESRGTRVVGTVSLDGRATGSRGNKVYPRRNNYRPIDGIGISKKNRSVSRHIVRDKSLSSRHRRKDYYPRGKSKTWKGQR